MNPDEGDTLTTALLVAGFAILLVTFAVLASCIVVELQ